MVDRLEELLALLEEEEEQEDVTLRLGAEVSAPPVLDVEMGSVLEDEKEMESPAAEGVSAAAGGLERQPEIVADGTERWEENLKTDGGMAERDAAVEGAFWLDGLTEAVTGSNGAVVLRRPGIGDVEPAVLRVRRDRAETAELDAAVRPLTAAERGLEGLYRQTVQAGHSAVQAAPVEQAGRAVRAEEPGRTAALTVDELDRAVRRDSRRYDGGMTIF